MRIVLVMKAVQQHYLLSAFDRLPEPSRAFGITARLITGSGTFMLTIVYLQQVHMTPQQAANPYRWWI